MEAKLDEVEEDQQAAIKVEIETKKYVFHSRIPPEIYFIITVRKLCYIRY